MTLLLISFVAGLLTVLAPCILPLLPVIVGGSVGGGTSLKRALTVTASLSVSVIVFTLLIKVSTVFINIPQDFWKIFSGGIIIVFGFVTIFPKLWESLPFLSSLSIGGNKILGAGYQKQNTFGDIIVGAALGPVFSTCSPTYFLVLAAVLPERFVLGLVYLIAYSVGLSISLLTIGLASQKIIEKVGIIADPHSKFKKVLGVLFVVVGLMIITGADKSLQIKILDAGFFDVTKIEQKLLNLVPEKELDVNAENTDDLKPNNTSDNSMKILSVEEKKSRFPIAPEISTPNGFINTFGQEVSLESLRKEGKVVLLDVWTYSCINCQRTIPYLVEWYKKYKGEGLVIVGLHTPEFAFESIYKNVENATKQFGIEYPVVMDNDYSTWKAYGNRYWPRKYLIDIDGFIIYDHIGEGGYEETEMAIQKALKERAERLNNGEISEGISVPKNVITTDSSKVGSPEVYFGASRNELFSNGLRYITGVQNLKLPKQINPNSLYLDGTWNIDSEYVENQSEGSIVFRYNAKNVYFVAGSNNGVNVEVYVDGKLSKTIFVKQEQLYSLVEGNSYGEHTLELRVKNTGLKAFTFTFG